MENLTNMNKEPKATKHWFDELYDKTKKFLSPTEPQDEISPSNEKSVSLNSDKEKIQENRKHGFEGSF